MAVHLDRRERERNMGRKTEGLKDDRRTEMQRGRAGKNRQRGQMSSMRFETFLFVSLPSLLHSFPP